MNLPPSQQIDTNLGTLLKASTVAIGLGTFLGCCIFVAYCLHLDYFPAGVSAGESLIFMVIAICFGFFYSIITACLLSVGVCISYIILNPLLRPLKFFSRRFSIRLPASSPLEKPFRFVKPNAIHWMLSLFGIMFIGAFINQNKTISMNLISCLFLLSVLWTLLKDNAAKRYALLNEPQTRENCYKLTNLNRVKYLFYTCIFIFPVSFGGIGVNTMEGSMRFSNLQKGDSYLLIQPPYSRFIPETYKVTDPKYTEPGYTTFKDINVKLTGVGQNTIIQFSSQNGNPAQPFEIPNDKIIVVPAPQ
ncbi:hypothetical protein [Acinetobacter lactucae]|uniref:hypothetical protein n=1 Tax=Acinetobacter lactucae TaxID=1785128 RepID=UPI000F7A8E12|nr:hypothetical protein [Acinetobacter lactucae]RSO35345.1 hypothetical protein EA763_07925 [Acinetobacter lactucae]